MVVNQYYRNVVEWWNKNLEDTKSSSSSSSQMPIKSTQLWTQFKRDMGEELGDIDATMFKDILCGFLGEDKVVKPKTKGGALELIGVKLRATI